jgi:methyl halide transferase
MSEEPTQAVDWETRYREGATGWERPGINPAFISWREHGELHPCRILVPGAGRSVEPLALAEAGFEVTVIDAAPSAIAVQKARIEGLHIRHERVVHADLFAWEAPAPFDAVYDQTCFCALPPSLWEQYELRLHRWLRPGGRLFVLFMQTGRDTGPPFHCDLGRMRSIFTPCRWAWPEKLLECVPHPSGLFEQPAMLERR